MSGAQHTPGPWSYRDCFGADDGIGYIAADGHDILHAGVSDLSREENMANNALVAASPDLLEALEVLIEKHGSFIFVLPGETGAADLERAQAAIAKARGQ